MPRRRATRFAPVVLALLLAACGGGSVLPGDGGPPADVGPRCSASETACGLSCVDTRTDPRHCGACGTACPAGQACANGACQTVCPTGQAVCAGACVNTQTDRAHCGACGTACPAGQVCAMGRCALECGPMLSACGGDAGPPVCADTRTDPRHCGACGAACPAGQTCAAGSCVGACAAGQTSCGGRCVDVQTDRAHCGACGAACEGAAQCVRGRCEVLCPAGQTSCAGLCAVLATDAANCGACGRACPEGQVCSMGACAVACAAPLLRCGAGATGMDAGAGDAGGGGGDAGVGFCADPRSDPSNCGACGAACSTGQACVAGRCAFVCPPGQTLCGAACVDTLTDALNCGRCGGACGVGSRCYAGACGPALSFRRPINVANGGGALADFAIPVEVDTAAMIRAGRMRSDCGDARFFDARAAVAYPYFLEGPCNSARTTFIVRVDRVPAGASSFWMYYGGAAVTSASSSAAAFLFFDDFGGLTAWTRHAEFPDAFTLIDTRTVDGRSVVRLGGDGRDPDLAIVSLMRFSGAFEVRRMVRIEASPISDADDGVFLVTSPATPFASRTVSQWTGDDTASQAHRIEVASGATATGMEVTRTEWSVSRLRRCPTGVDASYRGETLRVMAAIPDEMVHVAVVHEGAAGWDGYTDWLGVRRAACPDPTTMVGAEQPAP